MIIFDRCKKIFFITITAQINDSTSDSIYLDTRETIHHQFKKLDILDNLADFA